MTSAVRESTEGLNINEGNINIFGAYRDSGSHNVTKMKATIGTVTIATIATAAWKTAPLWAPFVIAAGPIAWAATGIIGTGLLIALIILKVVNKDKEAEKEAIFTELPLTPECQTVSDLMTKMDEGNSLSEQEIGFIAAVLVDSQKNESVSRLIKQEFKEVIIDLCSPFSLINHSESQIKVRDKVLEQIDQNRNNSEIDEIAKNLESQRLKKDSLERDFEQTCLTNPDEVEVEERAL